MPSAVVQRKLDQQAKNPDNSRPTWYCNGMRATLLHVLTRRLTCMHRLNHIVNLFSLKDTEFMWNLSQVSEISYCVL